MGAVEVVTVKAVQHVTARDATSDARSGIQATKTLQFGANVTHGGHRQHLSTFHAEMDMCAPNVSNDQ